MPDPVANTGASTPLLVSGLTSSFSLSLSFHLLLQPHVSFPFTLLSHCLIHPYINQRFVLSFESEPSILYPHPAVNFSNLCLLSLPTSQVWDKEDKRKEKRRHSVTSPQTSQCDLTQTSQCDLTTDVTV